MHYKKDDLFLRYLTMSFVGESAAIELMRPHGHIFEFDGYGAGSREMFKEEWLKKRRTPDLVCKLCKQKLEVRAKSKLRVAMSHSQNRPFDRELGPDVWVGFLSVKQRSPTTGSTLDLLDPESYVAGGNLYVTTIEKLSATTSLASLSDPKPQNQGSEQYYEWPTLLSPCTGTIRGVKRGTPSVIVIASDNGKDYQYTLPVGAYLYGQLRPGDRVEAGGTMIAGIAKMLKRDELTCPKAFQPMASAG